MKKRLILIMVAMLFAGNSLVHAQTFHVSQYYWVDSIRETRGKVCEGGFNIVVDFDNRVVSVDRPDNPEKYVLTDIHPTAFEKETNGICGVVYCGYSENYGNKSDIYLRKKDDKVFQIVINESWYYDIDYYILEENQEKQSR